MSRKRGQGEDSIYQMKDGRWRAAVSIGWKKNEAGEPVQSRKVFTAQARGDVQRALTKALRDRELGLPIAPEKQTVAQFLKHWLEQVARARVRSSTHASYAWIVQKHFVPGLGGILLSKLSAQQEHLFLNDRLKAREIAQIGGR
jgi:integrase